MTTIFEKKFKCKKCKGVFQGTVLGSMGYRGVDKQLCREYWGLNPMPYFLTTCPHCNYVDWTGDFEEIDEEPDDSLLKSVPSCESFEKYTRMLIEQGADPAMIAYASHQSGCCRRINGEDPSEQFKRAAEYSKKAQANGISEIGNLSIDEWITRMETSEK